MDIYFLLDYWGWVILTCMDVRILLTLFSFIGHVHSLQ